MPSSDASRGKAVARKSAWVPALAGNASAGGAAGRTHERRLERVQGQASLGKAHGIRDHVERPALPAPGIHLDDALNATDERGDLVLRELE